MRPASARSLKRLVQFSRKPLSCVGAGWRRWEHSYARHEADQTHEPEVCDQASGSDILAMPCSAIA